MFLTEREIFDQYHALKKTFDYFMEKRSEIKEFISNHDFKSLSFIGCGSSYCLCQSGEMSTKIRLGLPANALAAGDLLVNFDLYRSLLQNTLIIAPSRSGDTSEVVRAVEMAKELGVKSLSISAKVDSSLDEIADLSLALPWAFDQSICQTRTVSNLYVANLLMIAIIGENDQLIDEIATAISLGEKFMADYRNVAKEIVETSKWNKAVILADSELQGMGSEAALALMEIPQIPSNYYHVLDVRHGPMVLIDQDTLVIMACSPEDFILQRGVVTDLKKKGATVVTIGIESKEAWDSCWHINIPKYKNLAVMGIPFIFIPQIVGYYKALKEGVNPDLPAGLQPWIELDL